MIAAIVIIASLALLSILVWRVVRHPRANLGEVFQLNSKQGEVDIGVLSLLLSRQENEFLRKSLSPEEFRRVRRERLALAHAYLKAITANTGQFILAAEAARSSADPAVAQAAHELLQIAFRIRLNVPVVQICLIMEWLLPSLSLLAPPKLERYREMGGRVVLILERLQAGATRTISAR